MTAPVRNRLQALISSVLELLDDFLAHEPATAEPPRNLLDEMPDYMPKIRML